MSKRKNSVAWVRLDGNNVPIPGTLIYRQKKPYGKFAKMINPAGDLCCATARNSCGITYGQDYVTYTNPDALNPYYGGISSDSYGEDCFIYSVGEVGSLSGVYNFDYQPLVQKTDKDGNVLWSKRINTEDGEWPDPYISGLRVDPAGDVIVIFDIALVKLDGTDGTIIWRKQYSDWTFDGLGTSFIEYMTNVAFDSAANVYVGGSLSTLIGTDPYDTVERTGLVMKLAAATGNILATKSLDLTDRVTPYPYTNEILDIQVASDGSLRVLYNYRDDEPGLTFQYSKYLVAKLNSSLVPVWSKELDFTPSSSTQNYAETLIIDSEKNTIVTGYGNNYPTENRGCTIKLDDNGQVVWNVKTSSTLVPNLDFYQTSVDSNNDILLSTTVNPIGGGSIARLITKLSGVDGSVLFSYTLNSSISNMNFWWNYTPRAANFIYGDTLYMSSYGQSAGSWIQTFNTKSAPEVGSYPAGSQTYKVASYSIFTTPGLDVVTKAVTLTTATIMSPITFTVIVEDDNYLVHSKTSI